MNHFALIKSHISDSIEKGTLTRQEGDLLLAYIAETQSQEGGTPDWVKNKYHLLYRCTQVLHEQAGATLDACTTADVLQTVGALRTSEYSPNYIRQLIHQMRDIGLWLADQNPALAVKKLSAIKLPPLRAKNKCPDDMLSKDEVLKLIAACGNSRDRAMVAMLYDGACRAADIIALNWSDIVFDQYGAYFVTRQKTGRRRRVRLTLSVPYLAAWRADYRSGEPVGDAPVFITLKKHRGGHFRVSKDVVDSVLVRLREETGITKAMPSIFRPTRTTHDVEDGVPLPVIMLRNWGHLGTKMIDVYTNPSDEYLDQTILEHAGMKTPKEIRRSEDARMKPKVCSWCGELNPVHLSRADICYHCGQPMTEEAAKSLAGTKTFLADDAEIIKEEMRRMILDMKERGEI